MKLEGGGLAVFSNAANTDFWIVVESDDSILDWQVDLSRQLTRGILASHKEADKNMSMLVLWKDAENSDDVNERIISLETDPVAFKKYVLAYRQSDFESIKDIDSSGLMGMLMDPMTFERLKEELTHDRCGETQLLYSIAHKLPFLMTEVTQRSVERLDNHFIPAPEEEDLYGWMHAVNVDDIESLLIKTVEQNEEIQHSEDKAD